jgi:mannosyl-glycoprotein endo-beta-N-acetylglucosaminidase
MQALAGQPLGAVLTSSVQVLPGGNVPTDPSAATAEHVSPTTTTQWVKNSADTTLWSGPDTDADAFTDVPAGGFFRVTGPARGDRTPVYYVGDGLMRMAGDGWVDTASVDTVDAPAPGQVPAVDADARNALPVWVQAHRATPLMSGPDDNAVTLTNLPQWTFLKVAGVEHNGRMLVNYAGDYATRQPGIGWVDESSVGPAGDPGIWVSNFKSTPLWSGVDGKAVKFTDLPQWSKLRIVDGATPDPQRIQVQFFGDGFRQPGTAWIAVSDIGPITPPVPLPQLPSITSSTQVQHQTFGSGDDFINAVGAAARVSMKTSGVPASVTVAQAILESDWGRSRLTQQGNNLFGIKALGGPGPDGVVTMATWEQTSSGDVIVQAPFRAYYTLEQSIDDHGKFFTSNKRYADAMAVASDARAFAKAIQNDGYATDPSYASKLIGLMDKYNLYQFDQ